MTLFFARRSPAGLGGYDLYMTRLTEQGNSFFEPTLLACRTTPPTTTICSPTTRAKAGGSSSVTASLPRGRSTSIASLVVLPSSLVVRVVRRRSLRLKRAYRRATLSGVLYEGEAVAVQPTTQREEKAELTFHLQGRSRLPSLGRLQE